MTTKTSAQIAGVAHFTMFTKPSYVDFAALMSFAGAIFFPKNHAPLGRDVHALAMAAPALKCGAVSSRLIGSLPYRPRAMLLPTFPKWPAA